VDDFKIQGSLIHSLEGGIGVLHDFFLNGIVEPSSEHLVLNDSNDIFVDMSYEAFAVFIGSHSLGCDIWFAGEEALEGFYVLGEVDKDHISRFLHQIP
jgi:hypothetical protein